MRYWDTTKDKAFDEALDALAREQYEIAQLERAQERANIGNKAKLYGAI
jgi:hypothetical protein